jgi:hypothetical protein
MGTLVASSYWLLVSRVQWALLHVVLTVHHNTHAGQQQYYSGRTLEC